MKSMFDAYGELGKKALPDTMKAGRYSFQADAEALIVPDVESKLQLSSDCTFLEIGCGSGNLLIPLSALAKSAVGIDHPNLIAAALKRDGSSSIDFRAGQFPDIDVKESFDRILIYSVLHCLQSFDDAIAFIDRACALLAGGGRLLLGDIPNSDRKARFNDSPAGIAFASEWTKLRENSSEDHFNAFANTANIATLDDDGILSILTRYRKRGFDVFVVEQDPNLPFGHTREDIIIVRP